MNRQINNTDPLPIVLTLLSNAFPPVGRYLGDRYGIEFPKKARTALINAIIGIPVGLIAGYLIQTYIFN